MKQLSVRVHYSIFLCATIFFSLVALVLALWKRLQQLQPQHQARTFWKREGLGVQLIAELFELQHVFVIVGAQQCVVSHHLVTDGHERRVTAAAALCMAHPQRVRVLLVAHRGHILPDVAQGAAAVLSPHKLKIRPQLHCQNQN